MKQKHTDCTRVAQYALVLGPSVQSDPTVPAQSGDSTIQPDPAQEPVKLEPTCLAPRATAIKQQGFSEATPYTLWFLTYSPHRIFKLKVTMAKSKLKSRSHHEISHLNP